MSISTAKEKEDGALYSPFWPIFIVFAVITLMQFFDAKAGLDRRKQMKAASTEFNALLPKATVIEKTVEKVGQNLIALSDGKTNEAAKIIAEFNIRMNAPASPPAR